LVDIEQSHSGFGGDGVLLAEEETTPHHSPVFLSPGFAVWRNYVFWKLRGTFGGEDRPVQWENRDNGGKPIFGGYLGVLLNPFKIKNKSNLNYKITNRTSNQFPSKNRVLCRFPKFETDDFISFKIRNHKRSF